MQMQWPARDAAWLKNHTVILNKKTIVICMARRSPAAQSRVGWSVAAGAEQAPALSSRPPTGPLWQA